MPELPEVEVYLDALRSRILGRPLEGVRLGSPFLVRTVDPPALVSESHTLKRALTDPRLFSGIGNAWSDEILHRAKLSPFKLTRGLPPEETEALFQACRHILTEWTGHLRSESGDRFPEKVSAFHEGMAVHDRFGKPCPVCGTPVQRLVYADSEANYCPTCQTGGRLLADRTLPAPQEGLAEDAEGAGGEEAGGAGLRRLAFSARRSRSTSPASAGGEPPACRRSRSSAPEAPR